MKMKNFILGLLTSCSMFLLAACSHHNPADQSAVNDANAAYNNAGAHASGLGEDAGFGDQAGGGSNLSAKNIYYFPFDSSIVNSADLPKIYAKAAYLVAHPNAKYVLEGNTDPRGSREYNIGLGERRAKAIAAILTQKGVNPAQIRIVSYGAEKLAVPGHTEADYQQDRRVVVS